ncbi:hypothetical protein KIW84_064486 [Lathyrus oleraceus]|uniref:Uncharacterized protein n=1 Tax=Pisum sativum TaxID=3888 RepID=A0A9D5AB48_PEA|nr:hypothetical protein KIW84_064486 [Pisum sativum]
MKQPMIEENITPPTSLTPRWDETSSSERTPRLRSIEELYEGLVSFNNLEEQAIHSYTEFFKELDKGNIENVPAPAIAS